MQNRAGRRGAVFSIRVTDQERERLEALQRAARASEGGGPRALGPWLVWSALRGTPRPVLPEVAPPVLPELARGTTRAGVEPPPSERVILDLCAGSGSWSKPYEEAGYDVRRVTLPETDVRLYAPPERVWGVLAAPPCDQFSLARNGTESPRDFLRGLETVSACMRIVLTTKPRWWALENPVGLLSSWLGTPRDVWEPCDFGDPWTKRTAIWGEYVIPERGPFVEPKGGGPFCEVCDPKKRKTDWCSNSAHRAVTPQGFARAFFRANP